MRIRKTMLWLPFASLTILVVLSGQNCIPGNGRVNPCFLNTAPTANAGPDLEVQLGARVPLNGMGSSDLDGDSLSYFWQVIRSPQPVAIDDAETATPSFLPPAEGVYEISLRVSDPCGETDIDAILISVGGINCEDNPAYPEAQARTDLASIPEGAVGNLNGSTSIDEWR